MTGLQILKGCSRGLGGTGRSKLSRRVAENAFSLKAHCIT